MALVVKDRVRETSTSTGTGPVALNGAVQAFQDFTVIGDGNTTYYTIVDAQTGDWEVGIGTYTLATTTLSRDTVLESSNANNLVNFAGNVKDVFVTYPAERSVYTEGSAIVPATTSRLGFANITQGDALSVLGVNGNAQADLASISAASDYQVLRRSGASIGFGAIELTQSGAVAGTLQVGNGGTGATTLTGYVIGNGTGAFTASSTIPNTNITGLGTMSTQNANTVAITGGSINGTTIGASTPSTGAFTTLSVGGGNISPQTGFRNRIINGSMVIDQRNAGASVTPTNGQYTLDRWASYAFGAATSKFTVQQNAGSVTPPAGFNNYLGVTSTSAYSVASGDITSIFQTIEGYNVADLAWGTANAQSITVSFWVQSSLTGTFSGACKNGSANRSYPFTYTISSTNTWEQKTITIPGDTTGTWNKTNSGGMLLVFSLGTGSTYSGTAGTWAGSDLYAATGATSVVGTNGATFYLTGVQIEKGSVATPFEFRSIGQELALCQRYFHKIVNALPGFSFAVLTDRVRMYGSFPVPMRATPTASITNPLYIDLPGVYNRTQSSANISGVVIGSNLLDWAAEPLNFSGLTNNATHICNVTGTNGSIQFNAEL